MTSASELRAVPHRSPSLLGPRIRAWLAARRKEAMTAYLFIAPTLIGYLDLHRSGRCVFVARA